MRPHRSKITTAFVYLAGAAVLVLIARNLVRSKALPSYSDYATGASPVPQMDQHLTDIMAPRGVIHVMVATSTADQEKGLGDRSSLAPDEGMLFVFTVPGEYGFWMKDMEFPLDMVWIGSDKRVAGVTPDISADTYPEVFFPPQAISYVLELNAGTAGRSGIASGTQLEF